jgi:hypothetical protein
MIGKGKGKGKGKSKFYRTMRREGPEQRKAV